MIFAMAVLTEISTVLFFATTVVMKNSTVVAKFTTVIYGFAPFCVRHNQPQISDRPMHGVQKPASDSGQTNAWGAETCLRFRADLCMECRNPPQVQGIFMHGVQKRAPSSGHIYAWGAETCLRFRADLCMGCRNPPQFQGRLMHGVHKLASDSGQTFQTLEWFVRVLSLVLSTAKSYLPDVRQVVQKTVRGTAL